MRCKGGYRQLTITSGVFRPIPMVVGVSLTRFDTCNDNLLALHDVRTDEGFHRDARYDHVVLLSDNGSNKLLETTRVGVSRDIDKAARPIAHLGRGKHGLNILVRRVRGLQLPLDRACLTQGLSLDVGHRDVGGFVLVSVRFLSCRLEEGKNVHGSALRLHSQDANRGSGNGYHGDRRFARS